MYGLISVSAMFGNQRIPGRRMDTRHLKLITPELAWVKSCVALDVAKGVEMQGRPIA